PRVGADRALKRVTESYWRGEATTADLHATAARVRRENWEALRSAGIDEVPCNDFSFYDHVLDTAVLVGAIPPRHAGPADDDESAVRRYFGMARGTDGASPLEMTKWFDTNYHYLVPEIGPDTDFVLDPRKPVSELAEALDLGLDARPVLLGPITFLLLSKPAPGAPEGFAPISRLDDLLDVYAELLATLRGAGARWVQLDEPALVLDQPEEVLAATARAYERLGAVSHRPQLLIATYFDTVGAALPVLRNAPVEGLALDFTGPARSNLDALAAGGGLPGKRLIAGVVDGRNVWKNDLQASLSTLGRLQGFADVVVAPSCSLLHVPLDLALERQLDPQIARWLAFARQKVDETVTLARGMTGGPEAIRSELAANRADLASRASAPMTRNAAVRDRVAGVTPADLRRSTAYAARATAQAARLALPPLPTTTIGSFPQTKALREARAALPTGALAPEDYRARIGAEINRVVGIQEAAGLDVLVHGEPERNDMVQYFAERLTGFLTTRHGWVQSFGTRYVRPPVIAGDVSRPGPMTVDWASFAQGLTDRPVKGMLTGPVTMLSWSYVRDDQPLGDTARQVALALRDEVADLEAAGLAIIQVDEPALREGLPLRAAARPDYLRWATEAFRLATSGVRDDTQIHTHMCYAEFGDVLDAIVALDADVISLEAARSDMAVVRELADADYPAAVGPGVYDIHSPRVPDTAEVVALLDRALEHLPAERVWVNPDCGLKTRREDEVIPALAHMVEAARQARSRIAAAG
ncbi:MAG TPA: 5-methyltetrahydropteroyltriglutamate--homocysteine S-methyltransferase, partial [Mycobacteriales bacterium]